MATALGQPLTFSPIAYGYFVISSQDDGVHFARCVTLRVFILVLFSASFIQG